MRALLKGLAVLGLGFAALLGNAEMSTAQQNPVIAIDVALEPDTTMIERAKAANARLRKAYPQGFALDATHNPHITLLQQFVRTADLDKVYAAVSNAIAGEKPTSWKLTAFKYYYIPVPPIGLAGIVVEPTDDLRRLQQKIIDAVLPFTVKTGTAAAFVSMEDGRDIQPFLIDYVTDFLSIGSGKKFNPHVTIGVASESYLEAMLAEPFESFTFSPAGASVYHLGTFGTARKELKALPLAP
jgi:2'-5' RNA ligase